MKTDQELRHLANEAVEGRVFGSWMIENARDIKTVFMPLGLGGSELFEDMKRDDIQQVYEYMHKAGPIAVNGLPVFFSMQLMTGEEEGRFRTMVEELLETKRKCVEA